MKCCSSSGRHRPGLLLPLRLSDSHVARGIVEVPEQEADAPSRLGMLSPMPGAPGATPASLLAREFAGQRLKVRLRARAVMRDDFGGGDRAQPQRLLEALAARLPAGSRPRTGRRRRSYRPAPRPARREPRRARRRGSASAPCSLRVTTRVSTLPARAATASRVATPASAWISASLANKMSIRPPSISWLKPSRWRSTQKLSDKVKATLRPASRAISIARTIA